MNAARRVASHAVLPVQVFQLERIVDDAGTLYVGDLESRGIPPIRRVAFITDVPLAAARGGHAHKTQDEYLVCVRGGVDVCLESRGASAVVPLRTVGAVLHLPAGSWRDVLHFAPGTLLALLAPDPFDASDYIDDYPAFIRWEAGEATVADQASARLRS
ncbi:MAG TPA: FdtA/QdtA family cupin domain-containing protein [Candidatus Elarobacter sp.]|jgi:hypothetical protein